MLHAPRCKPKVESTKLKANTAERCLISCQGKINWLPYYINNQILSGKCICFREFRKALRNSGKFTGKDKTFQ
jgi:hypothetical protein